MPMQFIVRQTDPSRPILYQPNAMPPEPRTERQHATPRPPRRRYVKKDAGISMEEVAKMRKRGVRWSVIEDKAGMSVNGLVHRLKAQGLYAPSKSLITDDDVRKAMRLSAEGLAWKEIAHAMGRSTAGIRSAVRNRKDTL